MSRAMAAVSDADNLASIKLFNDPAEAAPQPPGKRPLAVIGAGFSGTIAVLHLLRQLPIDQPVLLCERAPEFARGVAYATGDNDHLLNVRATNMSALAAPNRPPRACTPRRRACSPAAACMANICAPCSTPPCAKPPATPSFA